MLTTKPGGDGRISPPGLSVLAGPHKGKGCWIGAAQPIPTWTCCMDIANPVLSSTHTFQPSEQHNNHGINVIHELPSSDSALP